MSLRNTAYRVIAQATPPTIRRWSPGTVAVLAYHGVPDPGAFELQVRALRRCFTIIRPEEFVNAVAEDNELPSGAALLTFDDGDRSVYDHAAPVLSGEGLSAFVFPVTDLVGSTTPFWWEVALGAAPAALACLSLPTDPADAVRELKALPDAERREHVVALSASTSAVATHLEWDEVRALQDAGFEIGNHTATHPCLDRCSKDVARTEVELAHERLTLELGTPPRVFAYPNGNHDEAAQRATEELGYTAGFLFDHALTRPGGSPQRTSRIRVDAASPAAEIMAKASGNHTVLRTRLGGYL
jgi:peptidoglycan/xylan/chitin deacetylase (PgdA/CDA1 family)